MNILGLSGSTHDPAAALVIDGEIIAAIEEERITRKKHAKHLLPLESAKEVLRIGNVNVNDVDLIAYFLDPEIFNKNVYVHVLKNAERYVFDPISYRTSNFLRRGERYFEEANKVKKQLGINAPIEFVRHHLAHAASSFYLSSFDDAMILTLDNLGELESTTMGVGRGKNIEIIHSQNIPHSLGMLYATITDYLGFTAWDEEGKVMSLAAYGKPNIPIDDIVLLEKNKFKIKKEFQMIETKTHDRLYSKKLVKKYGPARVKGEPILQRHKDVAASVQYAVEEVAKHLTQNIHEETGLRKLCLAGGVALNCKMNGELLKLPFIDEMYVAPASGDAGSSLGAAIYCYVNKTGNLPKPQKSTSLGTEFDDSSVLNAIQKSELNYKLMDNLAVETADVIMKEKVVCWFQGRTEFGPRALGNRSILALPTEDGVRDYINSNVKFRYSWQPLCPSMVASDALNHFEKSDNSYFMNIAHSDDDLRKSLPQIFHEDGTARLQIVDKNLNEKYYSLLNQIRIRTGYSVLINTSFNLRGEPIVNSPLDAVNSFLTMPINSLIIGNYLVTKKNEN